MADGHLILAAGALLAAGLVASFVAARVRVPSLVLFLGVGMLVGSDGLGWITFDNYRLARTIGVVSLALILFEGGLTSGLVHLRPVLGAATALATVGTVITAAVVGFGVEDMAVLFVRELGVGLLVGVLVGSMAVHALRRLRLSTAGLYPVASLTVAALAYGGADTLHGSGFLAVYLSGLILGSATIPAERTVVSFHEGLGWLAQVAMFLTLGLLVFPTQLPAAALKGTVLAFVLVFLARPAAVAIATLPFAYDWRERLILGWAGLRGAVPVVLATFAVIDRVPRSLQFFNLVFFAVLVSTLVQGSTFEALARRLRLTTSEPALPRPLSESGTIRQLGAEVLESTIAPGDAIAGAHVRDLGLPRDAVVSVIVRDERAIPPRGSTRLRAGDELHLLISEESAHVVRALLRRWRSGPIGPPPRPLRPVTGRRPIFSVRSWNEERDGDMSQPRAIAGQPVIEQLRIRRDHPGGLWVLADGRYAVAGPLSAIGSRRDLTEWARRRMRSVTDDERAWLQNVIGALAADRTETAPRRRETRP
jgi:potassium/hydrogen antiporter